MTGQPSGRETSVLLAPRIASWLPVGFAVIAAVWLTLGSARADWVALAALLAACLAASAGRAVAGPAPTAAVAWSLVANAVLSEFIVYAGLATAASLHPESAAPSGPAAGALRGTFAADFGGAGPNGVWQLAVTAAIFATLLPMMETCMRGTSRRETESEPRLTATPRVFGVPCDVRLPLAGAVMLLAGERAALLAVLVLGVASLGAAVIDGARAGQYPGARVRYRGDGWLAERIGRLVGGRIPPLPPLLVGLLVTGVLVALGLRNLPGFLILTPVEAMLLAALGSGHPHDGRADWLIPPLLHAAEYVFIAAAGFAAGLWPPITFALVAAAGLRHLDLAYRVRGGLAPGTGRRGLGWEGRMIVAGVATATGIGVAVYPVLAVSQWWMTLRDWSAGWSARHATVDR